MVPRQPLLLRTHILQRLARGPYGDAVPDARRYRKLPVKGVLRRAAGERRRRDTAYAGGMAQAPARFVSSVSIGE